jgi:hypothetical protein
MWGMIWGMIWGCQLSGDGMQQFSPWGRRRFERPAPVLLFFLSAFCWRPFAGTLTSRAFARASEQIFYLVFAKEHAKCLLVSRAAPHYRCSQRADVGLAFRGCGRPTCMSKYRCNGGLTFAWFLWARHATGLDRCRARVSLTGRPRGECHGRVGCGGVSQERRAQRDTLL